MTHSDDSESHDSATDDAATDVAATDDIGMTEDEKRHDELTRAPKSTEADAAPRITVTEQPSGAKRIDIADTAAVRPGSA